MGGMAQEGDDVLESTSTETCLEASQSFHVLRPGIQLGQNPPHCSKAISPAIPSVPRESP